MKTTNNKLITVIDDDNHYYYDDSNPTVDIQQQSCVLALQGLHEVIALFDHTCLANEQMCQ